MSKPFYQEVESYLEDRGWYIDSSPWYYRLGDVGILVWRTIDPDDVSISTCCHEAEDISYGQHFSRFEFDTLKKFIVLIENINESITMNGKLEAIE